MKKMKSQLKPLSESELSILREAGAENDPVILDAIQLFDATVTGYGPTETFMDQELIPSNAVARVEQSCKDTSFDGVTIVLERLEASSRGGIRRFCQLRAYCDASYHYGSCKEVHMRIKDAVPAVGLRAYLDLVCREIRRIHQRFSRKLPSAWKWRRTPRNLEEFVQDMMTRRILL